MPGGGRGVRGAVPCGAYRSFESHRPEPLPAPRSVSYHHLPCLERPASRRMDGRLSRYRRARGTFASVRAWRLGERILVRALMPLVRDGAHLLGDDEIVPFLSRCRVVLGLNEGRDLNGVYQSYMKLRDVEFPGHGCCYLTRPKAIGRAARRRVLTEHTWAARLADLARAL